MCIQTENQIILSKHRVKTCLRYAILHLVFGIMTTEQALRKVLPRAQMGTKKCFHYGSSRYKQLVLIWEIVVPHFCAHTCTLLRAVPNFWNAYFGAVLKGKSLLTRWNADRYGDSERNKRWNKGCKTCLRYAVAECLSYVLRGTICTLLRLRWVLEMLSKWVSNKGWVSESCAQKCKVQMSSFRFLVSVRKCYLAIQTCSPSASRMLSNHTTFYVSTILNMPALRNYVISEPRTTPLENALRWGAIQGMDGDTKVNISAATFKLFGTPCPTFVCTRVQGTICSGV